MQYYASLSASVHSFADKFHSLMKSGRLNKVIKLSL
jgi:hypothetical protein